MNLSRLFFSATVIFVVPLIVAAAVQSTDRTGIAEGNARVCYTGDATVYNPFRPGGYKQGSGITSTGSRYNPNAYEAALQITLARRLGCGIGRGRICYAAVQAPNGRSMIVRINDNGPMCEDFGVRCTTGQFERIIDLNEKSMAYLGNGSRGVIKNVRVCILNGDQSAYLGPVNEADRAAWANKIFNTPPTQIVSNDGGYTGTQYGGRYGTGFSSPYSSVFGGQNLYPLQAYMPYQASLPPQQAQVGQYFTIPTTELSPIPVQSSTTPRSSEETKGPTTVADELLAMIKPVQSSGKTPVVTIKVGASLKDVAVEQPKIDTNVTTTAIVPSENIVYTSVSETFTGVFPVQRSEALPPAVQRQSGGTGLVFAVLEGVRGALLRMLDILRNF